METVKLLSPIWCNGCKVTVTVHTVSVFINLYIVHCDSYTPKYLQGEDKPVTHTTHYPCVFPFPFSFFPRQMEETASITYHSSLAESRIRFIFFPFPVNIYSSPHSGQDDVLSASYGGVTEQALWKERARSVAEPFLWAMRGNAFTTLMQMSKPVSNSSPSGAQGAFRPRYAIS